jgi:hypothetical protein
MSTIIKKTVLKPCPFCGQKPKRRRITDHGPELPEPFWSVACSNRHCSIPCASGDTRQEADKAWNRRRCELNLHPIAGTEAVPFVAVNGHFILAVSSIEQMDGPGFVMMRGRILEGTHFNDSGNYGPGEVVTIGPITDTWRRISTEA